MEKLIEELETALSEIETDYDTSDYDCGMTDGFYEALQIVRKFMLKMNNDTQSN